MRTRKLLREKRWNSSTVCLKWVHALTPHLHRPKIVTLPARQLQREARRESKAHVAAQLETSIEKELLVRLKSGTYDNFQSDNLKKYKGVMESTKELNELQAQSKLTKHRRMHMEMEYEDGSEVS